MKFEPGKSGQKSLQYNKSYGGLSFSLRYHNIARYLFITLAFAGLLSTGWFGIPLVPQYLVDNRVDILAGVFTLFSALGTIWGVMAYREFTRSIEMVIEARMAARKLDTMVGEYEYRSYNPVTRDYETGFAPVGPIDFWDKETQVPAWMDKGKYWHILLSLQGGSKEIKLKVVKDNDLPFYSGARNVAVTAREKAVAEEVRRTRRYIYTVKIPQWLVMNTERQRFTDHNVEEVELSELISDLNRKIVAATDEVAEWERQRIRYPWRVMTIGIYLNKSLPLRIVYRQVIRNFPGAKRRGIEETNANLANVKDDFLVASLLELASEKGVPQNRIEMLQILLRFLRNTYTRLGLGEGASEYHSFHHSLEVSYMALHMIPKEFQQFVFGPRDYELMLVAGLLHDYDPGQALASDTGAPKGPSVARTMQEIEKTRILDAYFTMNRDEFENYFREFKSALSPPTEFATTHPEYVKTDWSPKESEMAQALIWRTDFPFFKQKLAQEMFARLLAEVAGKGEDVDRVKMLAEILWLADLAVTYMGSDPVRAWDRVTNLYDELNLPKLEAVPRTDAFFSDFAENEIFKQIINMRQFPYIFRQRWNLIYQFFHEGNPSTQLNRTIATARKMYLRVNLEIGMRRGEMLQSIAINNWGEYFIGIGKDQSEVFKAKSKFSELDPQNASAFWGDTEKLLPAITDRSIDNFLMVLPEHIAPLNTIESKSAFRSMLSVLSKKLVRGGTLRILTDLGNDSEVFRELVVVASQVGFQLIGNSGKTYFPAGWHDPEFKVGRNPHIVVLAPK
ncbi:MAG TPA: HD domain-containing protein [Nitrososphaera sp.]|nr:HD domain-containing protein [Nitrososphaera sp.]